MSFPPIESLVPHRAPMLALDALVACDDTVARAVATVRTDSAFVCDGMLPALATLEHMAQCAAAFAGFRATGTARSGYVVAVREMVLAVDEVPVGTVLDVSARQVWSDAAMASFECEVRCTGLMVASATMSVMHGEATVRE